MNAGRVVVKTLCEVELFPNYNKPKVMTNTETTPTIINGNEIEDIEEYI